VNEERRKFLKIILIGGTSFMVGKVLGPLFSKFLDDSQTKVGSKKENSSNSENSSGHFRVVENKQMLSVYDASGEEIFQIDKGA